MKKFCVIGNPIQHSLSPQIHHLFAQETNDNIHYTTLQSTHETFKNDVVHFFNQGGTGMNVTLPFKEKAFEIADRLTKRAKLCGAVNTLWMKDNVLMADNTDGVGFIQDLEKNNRFTCHKKTALIIGAGGSARGIIPALVDAGITHITLFNRTHERAEKLAQAYRQKISIHAQTNTQIQNTSFNLVVNTSSSSVNNQLPDVPCACVKHAFCYDLFYKSTPTVFVQWCLKNNAQHAVDGLGMLVGQAQESYRIWNHKQPNSAPVLAALKAAMQTNT